MGTPNVKQKSEIVFTSSGSGSANIHSINQSKISNIWTENPTKPDFARIYPSNLNVGKKTTEMNQPMFDSLNLAYNNNNCKYINPNLDLHDLYNTNNYVKDGANESGFSKFMNVIGKVLMGGMLVAGVGSIVSLFTGKNKTEQSGQGSASATAEQNSLNSAISQAGELSGSKDVSAVQGGIDNLDISIEDAKTQLNGVDTKIQTKNSEIKTNEGIEKTARESWRAKHTEVNNKQKEIDGYTKQLGPASQAITDAEISVGSALGAYDNAKTALAAMSPTDPGYAAKQTEVENLHQAFKKAEKDLTDAKDAKAAIEKNIGTATKEKSDLAAEETDLKALYDTAKENTQKSRDELAALNSNKENLAPLIENAEKSKTKLEKRITKLKANTD